MATEKSDRRPSTLGELRQSRWGEARVATRSVRDEMRENLLEKLARKEALFPGVIGYEETVIPQLANAILSRHHIILLGLRGQAKSRILRSLVSLLDDEVPTIAGCEINDNPYAPLCRACRERVAAQGDRTAIAWLPGERRYVEKLATPDVTIADIIGDVDPIRAARGGLDLSNELTIHYGLLPRANRGIFAMNELPDLAGKIQVGLFNIMQEGDVQIKGYPVRLKLDVALVFSANPEDYTARGKIITPLKDRIGSEIRTHYPVDVAHGMAITEQEAWIRRYPDGRFAIPDFIQEVVEQIAFAARESKHIDRRSGVSQRLPISCLENVVSSAERRAVRNGERKIVPRPSDVYAAMPSITGKLELEYEGEMKGGDVIATTLIKEALGRVFAARLGTAPTQETVAWFDQGGAVKVADTTPAADAVRFFRKVPGLVDATVILGVPENADPALTASACEFILEGLHVQQKIDRTEQRGYTGSARAERKASREEQRGVPAGAKRKHFN
ncbi:MAG: magnesium chelatase [candidate division NC10 bacterium RBG_16_65_8]|nr:MAG: magnesium chelatase [candidate division NC10 bacterium RBG_16_65_8]